MVKKTKARKSAVNGRAAARNVQVRYNTNTGRVRGFMRSLNVQGVSSMAVADRISTQDNTADSLVLADVNIKASRPQALHKKDVINMRFEANQCQTDSEFVKSTGYGFGRRLVWVPPLNLHWNQSGKIPEKNTGDARGTFIDIGKTEITITNILNQPIRFIMNSPRGRISDVGQPYVRRFKKEISIEPRGRRSFRLSWGDHANIFTPMQVNVPYEEGTDDKKKLPAFCLIDFMIILPDDNIYSGTPFKGDKTTAADVMAAEISVKQHYMATTQYAGTVEIEQRRAFCLLKNETKDGMLNEYLLEATELQLPASTFRSIVGKDVLHTDTGVFNIGKFEGRRFTIQGVPGFYQIQDGCLVRLSELTGFLDDVQVPSGAIMTALNEPLDITLEDVLGFLTTLTEVIRVVSVFF